MMNIEPVTFNDTVQKPNAREVAKDYVGVFFSQMVKEMTTDINDDNFERDLYSSFFNKEVGLHLANSETGDSLVEEIAHHIDKSTKQEFTLPKMSPTLCLRAYEKTAAAA